MATKMAVVLVALLAERVWKLYKQFQKALNEERGDGTGQRTNQIPTESPFLLGFSICAICRALQFLLTETI